MAWISRQPHVESSRSANGPSRARPARSSSTSDPENTPLPVGGTGGGDAARGFASPKTRSCGVLGLRERRRRRSRARSERGGSNASACRISSASRCQAARTNWFVERRATRVARCDARWRRSSSVRSFALDRMRRTTPQRFILRLLRRSMDALLCTAVDAAWARGSVEGTREIRRTRRQAGARRGGRGVGGARRRLVPRARCVNSLGRRSRAACGTSVALGVDDAWLAAARRNARGARGLARREFAALALVRGAEVRVDSVETAGTPLSVKAAARPVVVRVGGEPSRRWSGWTARARARVEADDAFGDTVARLFPDLATPRRVVGDARRTRRRRGDVARRHVTSESLRRVAARTASEARPSGRAGARLARLPPPPPTARRTSLLEHEDARRALN